MQTKQQPFERVGFTTGYTKLVAGVWGLGLVIEPFRAPLAGQCAACTVAAGVQQCLLAETSQPRRPPFEAATAAVAL